MRMDGESKVLGWRAVVFCGVVLAAASCWEQRGPFGVSFQPDVIQLGDVTRGRHAIEATLVNGLEEAVELQSPQASCDCVVVSEPPSVLRAGEQARFEISIDLSSAAGTIERRLLIPWISASGSRRGVSRVDLLGRVRDGSVLCEPTLLILRGIGRSFERRLRVFRKDSMPIKIESWEAPPPFAVRLIKKGPTGVMLGVCCLGPVDLVRSHEVVLHTARDESGPEERLGVVSVPVELMEVSVTTGGRKVFLGPVRTGETRFLRLSTPPGPVSDDRVGSDTSGQLEPNLVGSKSAAVASSSSDVIRSSNPTRVDISGVSQFDEFGSRRIVSLSVRIVDSERGLHEVRILDGRVVLTTLVYFVGSG